MPDAQPRVALFPGTFDPAHLGHIDIVRRGAALFDELVVAIGDNPEKEAFLDIDTRAAILTEAVAGLAHVRVETYTGLTVTFAEKVGAGVILRGIRHISDLDFELRMAVTNRAVTGIETLFIMPSPVCAFISSSLIRQIASGGGDVSALVPEEVLKHLKNGHSW